MSWLYPGSNRGPSGPDYLYMPPIPVTEKYKGNRRFGERLYDPLPDFHRGDSPTDTEVEEWWDQAEETMVEGMLYMNRRKIATFTPTRSAFRKWKPRDDTQPARKVTFSTEYTTIYYRLFNHEFIGRRKPEVHYARKFDCYDVLDDDASKILDKLAEEDEEYLYGPDPRDLKLEPEQEGEKTDEGQKSPVSESENLILTDESGAFTRMFRKTGKTEVDKILEASKRAPIVSAKAVMDELMKTGMPPFTFHPISPPLTIDIPLPVPTKCTVITRKGAIQVASLEPNPSPISSTMIPVLTVPKEEMQHSTNPAPGCQSDTNTSTTHGLDNDVKQAPAMDDTTTAATTPRKEIDVDLPIKKPVINSWLGDDASRPIAYSSRRDRELTNLKQRQEAELATDMCEDEKEESESHLMASTSNDHNSYTATDTDLDEESIDSDVTLIAHFAVNDIINDVKENPEEEINIGINCGTSPALPYASMSSSTSSTSMPKRFIPLELPRFPRTPTPRPFHKMLKRPNYLKFFSPNSRIDNERTTPKPPKIRAPKIHPEISSDVKPEAKKPKSPSAFKSFKSSVQSTFRCMFACVSKQ